MITMAKTLLSFLRFSDGRILFGALPTLPPRRLTDRRAALFQHAEEPTHRPPIARDMFKAVVAEDDIERPGADRHPR